MRWVGDGRWAGVVELALNRRVNCRDSWLRVGSAMLIVDCGA